MASGSVTAQQKGLESWASKLASTAVGADELRAGALGLAEIGELDAARRLAQRSVAVDPEGDRYRRTMNLLETAPERVTTDVLRREALRIMNESTDPEQTARWRETESTTRRYP